MRPSDLRTITKDEVRLHRCPTCLVQPGVMCIELNGPPGIRMSNHHDRVMSALRARDAQTTTPAPAPAPQAARMPAPKPASQGAQLPAAQAVLRRYAMAAGQVPAPRQRRTGVPEGVLPATAQETRATTSCPECGGLVGKPCLGKVRKDGSRFPIASHHAPRWRRAMELLGRPVIDLVPREG